MISFKCTQCSTLEERRAFLRAPDPPAKCDACGNDTFERIGEESLEAIGVRGIVRKVKAGTKTSLWILLALGLMGFLYGFMGSSQFFAVVVTDPFLMNVLTVLSFGLVVWVLIQATRP
jgi:hypothetical protein